MRLIRLLWFPFLILVLPALVFSLFLPYFPVDETRYLSVAWEMRQQNSFIVPLQNALPYSHKPPLLFWLFNMDWLLLGVNEATLRFIPVSFSLLNVALVHRISLLLWDDEKVARYAAIILSSTLSYLLWSALIMFDVVLTSWVLLAIFGLLTAAKNHSAKAWLLVGISIGGGLLTKGPVVLVYILPCAVFAFLWIPKEKFSRSWYAWLTLSLCLGIAIVLAWLIPAAMSGGQAYREAILWGQTVNRVANSFAHKRPFWWYLPLLPALLFPWSVFTPAWRGCSRLAKDPGSRLLIIWALSTLLIFSLISGKQFHYLIPVLPAFSMLMARNMALCEPGEKTGSWRYAIAAFYSALGVAAFVLSLLNLGGNIGYIGTSGLRLLALGLTAIGLTLFFFRQRSFSRVVSYTAFSSLLGYLVVFASGSALFDRYDLHGISGVLKAKQEAGYSVLHIGKYHGQYHFLGRLDQPLVALGSKEAAGAYAASHEKVALITYEPETKVIRGEDVYFQQPFRSKKLVLWNKRGISGLCQSELEPAGR